MNFEMATFDLASAEAELARRHPPLAALILGCGPCTLASRRGTIESHFEAIASSIVYQQLAGAAAGAIWGRVRALVDGDFTADAVLALESLQPGSLRSAGLSGAKARALADLSERVATGALDLGELDTLGDEEVVTRLSQVRGVGRWTAQMFLIFRLGRLDVWPTGDLGVRRGLAVMDGLAEVPLVVAMEALGERFRPWRSVVSWYCWRALEVADLPTGR